MFKYKIALLLGLAMIATNVNAESFPEKSLYTIEQTWTDETNTKLHLSQFSGNKIIMTMIYTSCKNACPLIMKKVRAIESGIAKDVKMHYVLITMDPNVDSVEKLAKYKKAQQVDKPNWHFLRAPKKETREFSQYLNLSYKKMKNSEHFMHDNKFFLLNEKGIVVKELEGLNTNENGIIHAVTKPTFWKKLKDFFSR